jgi:hypothetical protein
MTYRTSVHRFKKEVLRYRVYTESNDVLTLEFWKFCSLAKYGLTSFIIFSIRRKNVK